jgi:hypothetical protein
MVATRGFITSSVNLHTQTSTTLRAKPRWIKFAPTCDVWMFGHRSAAPTAVRVGHSQMALDSAPIGI